MCISTKWALVTQLVVSLVDIVENGDGGDENGVGNYENGDDIGDDIMRISQLEHFWETGDSNIWCLYWLMSEYSEFQLADFSK